MSADRDVTRIVRSWLEEGVTSLPDRVLDTVLDQLPATPQRRAWWPARRFGMMNMSRLAAAMGAVAVVAVVVLVAFPRASAPGQSQPSASPAPTPGASDPATPAPSPSPVASGPTALGTGPLAAGTYRVGPATDGMFLGCPGPVTTACTDTISIALTVPDGWSGLGDSIWLTDGENAPPAGAGLLFTRGAPLYEEPCRTASASEATIAVGSTAREFATALVNHPRLAVATQRPVSLAGYSGAYVDLQIPADITKCPTSFWPWEPGLYAQGPSQRWHLWILDVGGERVVVQSTDYAGTSAENRAELQAIVDSIQIQLQP